MPRGRRKTKIGLRKEPRQARAKATVEVLLKATAYILEREGFEGATTNRIAERAGVNIGSLYQYFPNKESLVAALIERRAVRHLKMIERCLVEHEAAPLAELIRAVVAAHVSVLAGMPRSSHVMLTQVPRVDRLDYIAQVKRRFAEMLRVELERRRDELRPIDLDYGAHAMVHVIDALTTAALVEDLGGLRQGAVVDPIAEIVIRFLVDA